MSDTTFEESRRCPKCNEPGEVSHIKKLPDGSKVHTIFCRTESCRWFDTSWIVQVMVNGAIPHRKPGEKDYPELPDWIKAHAQRDLDTTKAADEGDREAIRELGFDTTKPPTT